MRLREVRPIAICVFRDRGRLFVGEHHDAAKREIFYRPLGGAIEFGEYGRDCIIREIREEMGAEIRDLTYLGTMENIFVYDGKPGHEIVLVYEGSFADSNIYRVESIRCRNNGESFVARWKPACQFREGKELLYPEGLIDLLDEKTKR
jgi:8-oxo-dGTP pyrophosphatase MutT (NUDIX family)